MKIRLFIVFIVFLIICSPVYANELNLENTTLEQQYNNINITDSSENILSVNYTESEILSSENLNSTIECDDLTKVYGNDTNFTTTFYNTDGTLLTNSEVSFNLAGQHNNYTTDNNGKVIIPINYTPGIYYVGINNPITQDYTIKKINILPQIETHDLVKIYSNSSSFMVRILGLDGLPLSGQDIIIKITGPYGTSTYYRTTDNNGYAERTINLVPGHYNVTTEYNNLTVFNTIDVINPIESSNLVKIYHNSSSFIVRIIGLDGNPVGAGENVTFKITKSQGTTTTYVIPTDSNGYSTRTINLIPGNYSVVTKYNGVSVKNNITVLSPIITQNVVKIFKNDTSFMVRILGLDGNPKSGENITIQTIGPYGTATYYRTTDSNGYAERTINLVPGEYTFKTTYNGLTVKNNVTVISPIITSNLKMKHNDGNYFSAIILDGHGNPYPNQNLTIEVNSVVYNRVTDEYGVAIRTIWLAKGTYTVKTRYNGLTVSNSLVVGSTSHTRKNTVLESIRVDTQVVNPGNYAVRLKDSSGNYLSKKSVLFKFNNFHFNRLTDNNGFANLTYYLPEGNYNCNISFSGDTYYTKSSIIKNNVHVNKRNTILKLNNFNNTILGDNILDFYLTDDLGNPLLNQTINVTNGMENYILTTNNDGYARLNTRLNNGQYNINAYYSGNSFYNACMNSTSITVSSESFSYSLLIPNYVNVTNEYWTVYDNAYTHNFIGKTGPGGVIHMPVVRELYLLVDNDEYHEYLIGHVFGEGSITYGDSADINVNDINVHIESNFEYTNITYTGPVNVNGLSQISMICSQRDFLGQYYEDYEEYLLLVNGEIKLNIGLTSPLYWNEDGIRLALMENNPINQNYVLNCTYDNFNNYQSLKFSETGESIVFSSDLTSIVNLPSHERLTSVFTINNESITRSDGVSFGNHINSCGIESVQSYAISDCLVNDDMISYLINQSESYSYFTSEAAYSSFLTATSCIWMFDDVTLQLADLFNVSVNRDNFALIMSGIDWEYNAYIHCNSPILGLKFPGDNVNDTYFCRALSSLLLGDIEAEALGLSDRVSNSSLMLIFTEILAGANYTLEYNDGLVRIWLNDDENSSIVFDLNNGLVYDWTHYNGFDYKGAVSTTCNNNCPFLFAHIMVYKLYQKTKYKGKITPIPDYRLPEHIKRSLAGSFATLAVSSALILVTAAVTSFGAVPLVAVALPLVTAATLIYVAYKLNMYQYNNNNKAKQAVFEDIITGGL